MSPLFHRSARVGINHHVVMGSAPSLTDATLVAVFNSFFSDVVLFVHIKCVADGGTTGELKALYKRKIPYKVNLWQ